MKARGSSKSSASRSFVAKTRQRLSASLDRQLHELDLIALLIDGIEVARQTVVVALGITSAGTKVPLGLAQGSWHEPAARPLGLRVEDKLLCSIDGGKEIRKALDDVFGDRAVIQRCQVHKQRNLREHPQTHMQFRRWPSTAEP